MLKAIQHFADAIKIRKDKAFDDVLDHYKLHDFDSPAFMQAKEDYYLLEKLSNEDISMIHGEVMFKHHGQQYSRILAKELEQLHMEMSGMAQSA